MIRVQNLPRYGAPVVARSVRTGLGYLDVDWSSRSTGYVYVLTENGSRYIVRVSNVEPVTTSPNTGETE